MNNYKKFEGLLALHCSPTLAGIKSSNLVSCYKDEYLNLPSLINHYNNILNTRNIFLDILCEYESHYLVFIYNKNLLTSILSNPSCRCFLNIYGYSNLSIPNALDVLKYRLKYTYEFPHEIGLFLGYPLDDIVGFIENKGKNYKFFGYWKVYSNENLARELFKSYSNSRELFCSEILSGSSIIDIINIS